MDLTISAERQALVEQARELAAGYRAEAFAHDLGAEFPALAFERLREAGFLRLSLPPELGGQGFWSLVPPLTDRFVPYYQVLAALAAGDASTGQLVQIQTHATGIIARHANAEQRQRFLDPVARHGALISSCGSEADPATPSSPRAPNSEMLPVPGGFRVTAAKHFASLAPVADFHLVYLRAPGIETPGQGTVLIVVPRDHPGVSVVDNWDTLGMRATISWQLKLDDVFVPWENVLGQPGDWVLNDPRTFTLAYAANYLGTAQGAYDFVLALVRERPAMLDDDVTAYMLGEMDAALQAASASMNYAAWLWEQGRFTDAEIAGVRAVHTAKQAALTVTNKAIEVVGARGTFRHLPLERALRDVRTFTLHSRDSRNTRRIAEAAVKGAGHSKETYGPLVERLTWEQIGIMQPVTV
ncbi:MAG TPA: acyl-CoA dehydrogenase family protein [Dehalococcoidia bacterium]|nr:acyl-CoA dehydrogenase family protein [Dehalococcoidia bacterium]